MATQKVDIFWTGGWDSSFRVIQLLATTQNLVQPHYIVRHEHSTGLEINAMIRMRRAIVNQYPEVASRFLPTIYVNEDLITKYEEIDEQSEALKRKAKLNEQYIIMSNYCRQFNIDQIEVSIDRAPGEKINEWLDIHFQNAPIFKSFTFPIAEFTKTETYKIAKAHNWDKILKMTSFCRRPSIRIVPCGACGPCVDTVKAGLGFRLPLVRRIMAHIQIPFRKLWRDNYLKHDTHTFYKYVKAKFEDKV